MQRIAVAGGGLAAVEAVRALRTQGFAGSLVMVGAEAERPYDRPPLSKGVLLGEIDASMLDLDWPALDVDLRLGVAATGLRPGVLATTGGEIPYEGLVVATGSTPRRIPGDADAHRLRTLADAHALRRALRPGARVVLLGAGWIGAEVATAAARAGCHVTALDALPEPLATSLPAELGVRTRPWWSAAGVDLRTGIRVDAVSRGAVHVTGGETVPADVVVVGIGVRPDTDWLQDSPVGLGPDGAVLTDAGLRTGVPGVVAAGDCAAWESRRYGRRLRVEHWDTALRAPAVAAASLLGGDQAYDPVPYFWSEQFGRTVMSVGLVTAGDRWVWREDGESWVAFRLAGDRLVAAVGVDRPRDVVRARRLMESGSDVVDEFVLANPSRPVAGARA